MISQSHYATEVMIAKDREDPETKLDKDSLHMSDFRSAIGSLQWLSGTSRPDIAADASLLQRAVGDLTHGDLQQANQVLKYVKATADAVIKIRLVPFLRWKATMQHRFFDGPFAISGCFALPWRWKRPAWIGVKMKATTSVACLVK